MCPANSTNVSFVSFVKRSLGVCLCTVPNLLILCLLVGLAYWGHEHHWEIPKFSELGQGDESADSTSSASLAEQPTETPLRHTVHYRPSENGDFDVVDSASLDNGDPLPAVHLGSDEVVQTAGIHWGTAEPRRMEQFVVTQGVVDYDQSRLARLSTRVPGIVWQVEKRVGEQVSKGEVLALVDSAEIGAAKGEFMEALVQCDLKQNTVDRLKTLEDIVAASRLRQAVADWRAARIRLVNARQTLITMGLPIDIDDTSSLEVEELVSQVQFLGLPASIVDSIRNEAQSSNLIPLVSPLDGVVVRRDVMRGETAQPGQTLFVVADVSCMWLRLSVRAEDVNGLAIGQDVLFSTMGVRGDLHGELAWIDTEVAPKTRTVRALATVENPSISPGQNGVAGPRLLQANAYGSARVRIRSKPLTLAVPSSALRWLWNDSHYVIFMPSGDGTSFQPRRVHPGITQDGFTEILEGLSPGTQVAVSGTRLLAIELADALLETSVMAANVGDEASDSTEQIAEAAP
jgi:membrane fusion protein, heavy metal efflux system